MSGFEGYGGGLFGQPPVPMFVEAPNDAIMYEPQYKVNGWEYYSIAKILGILYQRCDREEVQDLCEHALSYQPEGLELRNKFLLPIRVGLQGWHGGYKLHIVIVTLIDRLLNDSVTGGIIDYNTLNMKTVVAWDQNKMLNMAVQDLYGYR